METVVKKGRYASVSDVSREGFRLAEEREARLQALRETLAATIERGGENTEADVDRALDATEAELFQAGY